MSPSKLFVKAAWHNLILVTYAIDPVLLKPYFPRDCEPDMIEGKAFVSFVAFEFLNTTVLGIKIPFHSEFTEINLRYYLKKNNIRGVAFIKELVPKTMVTLVAKLLYNEPYQTVEMEYEKKLENGILSLKHSVIQPNKKQIVSVVADYDKRFTPPNNSLEHFFKEHEVGYGKTRSNKPLTYRVEHPVWEIMPVKKYKMAVDFGLLYGQNWAFLNGQEPYNVAVAVGSEIKVFSAVI